MKLLAVVLPLVLLAAACPTKNHTVPRSQTALVLVECNVPDATIWIDDRPVAQVAEAKAGVRLKAGFHRLEVRHERYHTRYFELSLTRGETRSIEVEMVEVLD